MAAGRVEVRELDPRTDDLTGWVAVQAASLRADRPRDLAPPLGQVRAGALAGLPERDPSELVRLLVALEDDRPVGAARLELPLRDNQHLVYAEAHVEPGSRRCGVATGLLEAVLDRADGRTVLACDLDEPPGLVDASPGRAFLLRHGFAEGLREVRRELALPVPETLLDALEADVRERSAGYRVVSWRDRCPDELVDARAALGTVMSVDAPVGAMAWQQECWDAARVREREQVLAEQGRSCVVAAALSPAGELVAFTELAVRTAAPEHVEQWETLVLRASRGHRLGLLVKLAALRRLAVEHAGARRISTSNADTNRWMIAINESLGFVPDGLSTSWQRGVVRAPEP